ncbi:MlaC/ttg2D family ABC transporter substrate-binding protein [Gynuella sunshinyii]|uniref:ABC-type transport system involved in resistance to organic solvent, auxiliary component n=1 Tax=Gynuella sunshinyii YC6258 TaxID=1445510 RepID=A0A0C5W1E6_9GAMM|nr:ABC transporter substrate-binding protein [Gynuella sunshinyii]AJQ96504.1 ABC-type transport system involved in resistance to organic solvent, auxiliary component [Gynuella sunshinyii YC6258]
MRVVALTRFVLISFLVLISSSVYALTPDKTAEETVKESLDQILILIEKYGDQDDPAEYLQNMQTLLEPVVGYELIAGRVMGKYLSSATIEQKRRFLEVFKTSLINTYALGIKSFKGLSFEIVPSKDDKKDTFKNTRVYLEVVDKSGTHYPVVQSMYYSKNRNGWAMQNVTFNGVNIGVTFRNRFDRLMKEAGGDVDKAIDMWTEMVQKSWDEKTYINPSKELLEDSQDSDSDI